MHYDVAIIGAGLSGLAAGIRRRRLARSNPPRGIMPRSRGFHGGKLTMTAPSSLELPSYVGFTPTAVDGSVTLSHGVNRLL